MSNFHQFSGNWASTGRLLGWFSMSGKVTQFDLSLAQLSPSLFPSFITSFPDHSFFEEDNCFHKWSCRQVPLLSVWNFCEILLKRL